MSTAAHALFRCDGGSIPPDFSRAHWSHDYQLISSGADQNMTLAGFNEVAVFTSELTGIAHDLTSIAAYAYIADQMVSRGGVADAHHDAWRRTMALCVPVSDPDFWSQASVTQALQEALQFATDDRWMFAFSRHPSGSMTQLSLLEETGTGWSQGQRPDQVLLLSGGADSLCAAVQSIQNGRRPHIVSHRPSPLHDSRQKTLRATVGLRFGVNPLSGTRFPVHRVRWEARESSQRSRAFLFASLGAAMAYQIGATEVALADNGIVSIGLPLHEGLPGALMSRTTHPGFHARFNDLLARILPSLRVVNPLQPYTRAQALTILKETGCADLLMLTNSCSRARNTGGSADHCGYCSQCVDRRFGIIRAGLESHEPSDAYVFDMFTDELSVEDKNGYEKRSTPFSYVSRAKKIETFSDEGLFAAFPQLYDCLPADPRGSRAAAAQMVTLLRTHSDDVAQVVKAMSSRHLNALYHDPSDAPGGVSKNSLLRLVLGNGGSVISPSASLTLPGVRTLEAQFPEAHSQPTRTCIFRPRDDGWLVAFDAQEAVIKHREGMQAIAYLLARPYSDVSALDLRQRFGASDTAAIPASITPAEASAARLRTRRVADPLIDTVTKEDLGRQIAAIAAEREEADRLEDDARLAELDERLEILESYVRKASGLSGKTREFSDDETRARDALRQAVRRCKGQIKRRLPALAEHLELSLKIHLMCSYTPRVPITWDASPWSSEPGQKLSGADSNRPGPDNKRPA